MLGAFIAEGKPGAIAGWLVFGAASFATMTGSYLLSRHFGKPCEFFFVYLSPPVLVAAYGLFSAFMAMKPGLPSKILTTFADCSLGIYGLHVFVIDPLFKMEGIFPTVDNPWISTPLMAIGVLFVSFVIIFILRTVKPLRHFI